MRAISVAPLLIIGINFFVADQVFLKRQVDVLNLFYHIHEPIHEPELQDIVNTWDLEKNVQQFKVRCS